MKTYFCSWSLDFQGIACFFSTLLQTIKFQPNPWGDDSQFHGCAYLSNGWGTNFRAQQHSANGKLVVRGPVIWESYRSTVFQFEGPKPPGPKPPLYQLEHLGLGEFKPGPIRNPSVLFFFAAERVDVLGHARSEICWELKWKGDCQVIYQNHLFRVWFLFKTPLFTSSLFGFPCCVKRTNKQISSFFTSEQGGGSSRRVGRLLWSFFRVRGSHAVPSPSRGPPSSVRIPNRKGRVDTVLFWRHEMGVNPKIWENTPNHPFVHRVFHYKPSTLGVFPLFLETSKWWFFTFP